MTSHHLHDHESNTKLNPPARSFEYRSRVLLSDTTPSGRMRLDAVSRVLQDAATLDVQDAPVLQKGPWVVRWLQVDVTELPTYLDVLEIDTRCTGTGRAWAERTTVLKVGDSTRLVAVANWVLLDPSGITPTRLPQEFMEVYGPSAQGKISSPKLTISRELVDLEIETENTMSIRFSDLDILGHVNNAVYTEFIEEVAGSELDDSPIAFSYRIEFSDQLEFGSPVTVGRKSLPHGMGLEYQQQGVIKARATLSRH